MTTDPDLLDELLAAVRPYVKAAAESAPSPPAATFARIYPSPLRVDVAHHDAAGRVRVFRAPGDPVLAEVTARFLTAGVAALPEAIRRSVLRRMTEGAGELIVVADMDVGTVGGAFAPERDDAEPILLFVRHRPETRH
jgi:hypothetical protein